ncbi:DUF2249 domain-containing protein [Ottowia sp.]|jgi:hypothetical protein|uniref:DUF2249 domain-containing protein n=1 Tax=Ottowia sp. TaxID=1898956 RepID=UPI002C0A980A|nr:DUF2249 domain-containing protein [Ottowia sp.]HRN75033.1 DUF2249 domain-containing protein [Ottowia sp.]HRQ02137.1 DUF2249 domain-containing protein [Ottowia sp.]
MDRPPPPRRAVLGEDGLWHIDVRGLEPPQPLVSIVRELYERRDDAGARFVAHLDRDPVMLYPELAERGWVAERLQGDPGEVRLLLRRLG